ncbi:MAG TPA: hypothetical protein GXX63_09380 [Tissierellia bacterium]|nr:hypothetical protein [Tissierellia bacterium]
MKHRSFKLRWSRYYQFILEGQIFYLKLKAYTNKDEGIKKWELITECTYEKAIRNGHKDNVVIVEDEVSIAPVQALTLIFNRTYGINERDMRTAVVEAQESIRELGKHTEIKFGLEYKVFKRIIELKVKEFKEDYSRGIAI